MPIPPSGTSFRTAVPVQEYSMPGTDMVPRVDKVHGAQHEEGLRVELGLYLPQGKGHGQFA